MISVSKNHSPLVSVLMPVYNAEQYLAEAIESIIKQTFTDFEFIIVNDGSSDGSLSILQEFAQKDARIHLISRENKGISCSRNQLLELAKGKYLAWMDSDDISLPSRFELMVSWLTANPDHIALGCKTIFIDSEGCDICIWNAPSDHNGIDLWHISGKGGAIVFPSSMMLRDAVTSVDGFDEKLTGAEDLDLFLRLAEKGKIANIENILYKYRQHTKSISHTHDQIIRLDNFNAVSRACSRRGLPAPNIAATPFISSTVATTHIKWGWWALNAGNIQTARKYAIKSFMEAPFSLETLKLCACVIRGY
jgi:glycosyltransferase involved in cell wall biosynthesis